MYSKIKSLHIKNFRNLADVEISFEQSPIVALVGGNEAGKTSVIKAFAVSAINAFPQRQKAFIKTGERQFEIYLTLEDGTLIKRIKASDTNTLVIYKDSDIVFGTDKIDRGEGVPKELDKVMGLVIEPETKECLHIRTYEDRLLFVGTPTSTNYKVIYEALKVENLVKALKRGTDEVNGLRDSINQDATAIDLLKEQIDELPHYDIDDLLVIRERLLKLSVAKEKMLELLSAVRKLNTLKAEQEELSSVLELKPIDAVIYKKLGDLLTANRVLTRESNKDYESLKDMDSVNMGTFKDFTRLVKLINTKPSVDYTAVKELPTLSYKAEGLFTELLTTIDKLQTLNTEHGDYTEIGRMSPVSATTHSQFESLMSKLADILNLQNTKVELDRVIDKGTKETEVMASEAGLRIERCPRCGEVLIL